MSFMNPHLFAAILDGIAFKMIVVMECECVQGNEEYCPPRFTVGAVNGTRDPRMAQFKQLLEVGVQCDNLHIPYGMLLKFVSILILILVVQDYSWLINTFTLSMMELTNMDGSTAMIGTPTSLPTSIRRMMPGVPSMSPIATSAVESGSPLWCPDLTWCVPSVYSLRTARWM